MASTPLTRDLQPDASAGLPEAEGLVAPTPPAVATESASPHDRHFRTDHLMDDLKGRSIRGGAVTLAAQGGKFALKLGETIILARLLTPADFGLVAMVTAITGMVAMFKDAGLSMATVQRPHITHNQVSTLFWINVALSVLLMVIVAALAPLVVWLYGEPRLLGITLAVAGTFIFAGLGVQHTALLKRQMRFTDLAAVDLTTMVVSVLVAIGMAWQGAGYWALVGLLVTQPIAQFLMVWWLSGWIPGWPSRNSGVKSMLSYGGYLTGANILVYIRRNIDNMLLGAFWGPSALGLYMKAYQLLTLPVQQANGPLSQVVLPALSRLVAEPQRYRSFYCRAIFLSTSIAMPLVTFAIIGSEPIIALVLGSQWLEAVPIFIALAPAAGAVSLNIAGAWVFMSTGRTDKQFKANIGMVLIIGTGIVLGIPWGPLGVAYGFSISTCLVIVPFFGYAVSGSPVSLRDIATAVWRPSLASILAAIFATAASLAAWDDSTLLHLVIKGVSFGVVYCALWYALAEPRNRPLFLLSNISFSPK